MALGAALLLAGGAPARNTTAAFPANKPSLSVHESCYGTLAREGKRECIQGLEIRLVSYEARGFTCRVECFFLKRGRTGTPPSVDDAVIFDATNPHGNYAVTAKPILLPSQSGNRKPGNTAVKDPREGWVVRVLHDGVVLEERCSSHGVEQLVSENPDLLASAAKSKKARHLKSAELLKH